MAGRQTDEESDFIPELPPACQYCGGHIVPKASKPKYAGTCKDCGAEYGLSQDLNGRYEIVFEIHDVVWRCMERKTPVMYYKQAKEAKREWLAYHSEGVSV